MQRLDSSLGGFGGKYGPSGDSGIIDADVAMMRGREEAVGSVD